MIIEQTIIEYLSKALTVPVYAEVPDSAPASYVLVEKTSSSRPYQHGNIGGTVICGHVV